MPSPRPPKKSETLEIRLPYAAKQAFMARCQEDGVSASEALRRYIDGQLAPAPAPSAAPRRARRGARLAVGALIAAAVGAVALPSLARPVAQDVLARVAFEQLDTNHDGVISFAEYERARAAR